MTALSLLTADSWQQPHGLWGVENVYLDWSSGPSLFRDQLSPVLTLSVPCRAADATRVPPSYQRVGDD